MNEDVLSMLGNEEPQVEEKKTKPASSDSIDKDVFASMLTADGKDGNFNEDKEPEVKDTDEPSVKIKAGKVKEQIGKYADEVVENVKKHPDKYYVETSRGTMSIKEAIAEGWNPETGEFDETKSISKMKESELGKLSQSDRDAVEGFLDPSNAGIAAADAEGLGLDPDSPMIAQPPGALQTADNQGPMAPPEQAPQGQMPGGEGAMPPSDGEDMAGLAALLGGGQ